MTYLKRPDILEKAEYLPGLPVEEFIVPLLRQYIEDALTTCATGAPLHSRALDVGCGRQPFRKKLESIGYSYTSMDVHQSPEDTVDIICAIDEPLPLELTSCQPFHFVFCTEVMEHVADWDMAFKNLATLMEPGGRLLITCPHFYILHEEPYDFWRATPHALRYFADRVGFKILYQETAGDAWDILGTLLANCNPSPVSKTILNRGITKLVRLSQQALFNLLLKRWLQKVVQLHGIYGRFYLSNIIVFEKI